MKQKLLILILISLTISLPLLANNGPATGQQAPGFQLTDMDKTPVTLTTLRKNGPVLMIFWSTRCPVCHAMLPQFKLIHKKYKAKKLTVAGINVGYENHEQVADYVLQHNIKYLVLNQDNRKELIAKTYKLVGTPTIILVNSVGKVIFNGHHLPDLEKLLN